MVGCVKRVYHVCVETPVALGCRLELFLFFVRYNIVESCVGPSGGKLISVFFCVVVDRDKKDLIFHDGTYTARTLVRFCSTVSTRLWVLQLFEKLIQSRGRRV